MRMTFRKKALFFLIPVLVVISCSYTFISIATEKKIVRDEIIKRAETITTLATKTGELPILSGNPEQMNNTVSFLRANAEVSSVAFYDARKEVLIQDGLRTAPPLPSLTPDVPITKFEENDSFIFYAPIFTVKPRDDFAIFENAEGVVNVRENIGWIRLGFSKAAMRAIEQQLVVQGLVLAVLFTSLSSALVYFLITVATRPLARIVKVANAIAHGDLQREIEMEPGVELGALTLAFATMKNTIRQVLRETESIIQAVQEGNLGLRSNAAPFEGEWRELIEGVNHLTDAFATANDELKVAKEAAEGANRAKSEFLSSMSHELRTPLNAILGYAQILMRHESMGDEQRQQLAIMRSSGEHLLMLINDILDVGKIEAEKMAVEEGVFDLAACIRQVINITRLNAEEKDLRFLYETASPLPAYVRGDERKLRQILLNLLSNAVKYTRHGSVTLRVGYDREQSGMLHCEVADTGIGIPSDRLETIFEPFTQLITDGLHREGTGLGLTITKRLLTLLQGELLVESTPGKGTVFWMHLPLPAINDVEQHAVQGEPAIVGYVGERKTILVVDDNVTNASLLVSLLEPLGFKIFTASNGQAAVRQALTHQPHLIIMDLVMPEMDGLAAVAEIRGLPPLAGVRIIGASATATENAGKAAFVAACDAFVVKPFSLDALLEKIHDLLGIQWLPEVQQPPEATPAGDVRNTELPFALPPAASLKDLHELALLGDMRKILAWADNLVASDRNYALFADTLRDLAGGFRTKALLNLVEQHLGELHEH